LPAWRYVFNNAPKFQMLTYTKGEDLLINIYQQTKDKTYVDTLMMLYDQWAKYFGDHQRYGEGYILGKKGATLYRFFQITFGFIEFLTFQEHDSQAISRISSRIQLVQLLSYSCI
jgi:hypothetical protein